MKVGYIGLGAMGSSLATHLLAGNEVMVHDLNEITLSRFRDMGASVATTLAELAAACPVIILCLPRSSDVEKVLFGSNGLAEHLQPGALIIDQTSGVPELTAAFAARLAEAGVNFVDAPVSGGIPAAKNRTVTIMASGNDVSWELAEPILGEMSNKVLRCGTRVGDGQAIKLITNGIGACYRMATLELVALGVRRGLGLAHLVRAINEGFSANFTSRNMLVGLLEHRSTTDFAMSLMLKDLNAAIDLTDHCGCPFLVLGSARNAMALTIPLFGKDAKLEDVIGLTELLFQIKLRDAVPTNFGEVEEQVELLQMIVEAVTACNMAAILEGAAVGASMGIEVGEIARAIDAGSAWSAIATSVLRPEFASPDHAQYSLALERAWDLATSEGVPAFVLGGALARWRSGLPSPYSLADC